MDIADKIKYLRKDVLNLKKTEFARKLSVTRLTVHNWEVGITHPTADHIVSISLLCNVTPDYLIFDNEEYQLSPLGIDDEGYSILQSLIHYYEKENTRSKQ